MTIRALKRKLTALGTVLGLSVALPFAMGATPAYAAAQMSITKTHTGNFARGGTGVYRITVTNTGDEPTGNTTMTDTLPQGLQVTNVSFGPTFGSVACSVGQTITCQASDIPPTASYTIIVTVAVAADAPCSVSNNATVHDGDSGAQATVSDPTVITGGSCDTGGGGGGGGGGLIGSLLPVNLDGVLPMFNNISTNNNLHSPGASNTTGQNFGVNAP